MTALTPGMRALLDTVVDRFHGDGRATRERAVAMIVDVDERLSQYHVDSSPCELLDLADAINKVLNTNGSNRDRGIIVHRATLTSWQDRLRSIAVQQSLIIEDLNNIARTLRSDL